MPELPVHAFHRRRLLPGWRRRGGFRRRLCRRQPDRHGPRLPARLVTRIQERLAQPAKDIVGQGFRDWDVRVLREPARFETAVGELFDQGPERDAVLELAEGS